MNLLTRTLGETIEIESVVDSDVWTAVADPGQLESALLNLAINARDAMPGGGKLTVKCYNTSIDAAFVTQNSEATVGDFVVLAVADTGTGMSEEVRTHVFEPFFTTKEVGHGSGLGLSMVYGFAKQSGGHAVVESAPGAGTVVSIYLPRTQKDPTMEVSGRQEREPRGGNETVLVVEDDLAVRDSTCALLRSLGYRVVAASDAKEARLALLEHKDIDVILSDIVLPGGVSGTDFIEETKRSYPKLKFVLMSGYSADHVGRREPAVSETVFLPKPFQTSKLADTLRELLD